MRDNKNQPPKQERNRAEKEVFNESPGPYEKIDDPFIEGTEMGEIKEEWESPLPPEEEWIPEE